MVYIFIISIVIIIIIIIIIDIIIILIIIILEVGPHFSTLTFFEYWRLAGIITLFRLINVFSDAGFHMILSKSASATRPRALDSRARQPTDRQPTNQKTNKGASQQCNKPTMQQTNKATSQQTTRAHIHPQINIEKTLTIVKKSTKIASKSVVEAVLGASWSFFWALGTILAPRRPREPKR